MGDFEHAARMTGGERDNVDDARATTLALLARRSGKATLCPSEVARAIAIAAGTTDWRGMMPRVHAAIDLMVADGLIRLSWKGKTMAVRDGPYRIGRCGGGEDGPGG